MKWIFDWKRAGLVRPSWRKLSRTFFTGLIAVLPIMVTLAVILWLIGVADSFFGGVVRLFLPNTANWPGAGLLVSSLLPASKVEQQAAEKVKDTAQPMVDDLTDTAGLLVSLIVIFVIGLLMQAVFFRELMKWLEEWLEKVPLIKTVYSAVRDLTGLMSPKKDGSKFNQVVLVQQPGLPIRLVGFVTTEDLSQIGSGVLADSVAVYLPMSYQIGGYTLLLPREYLTPVDMSMEDAMRFVITAGVSRHDDAAKPKLTP